MMFRLALKQIRASKGRTIITILLTMFATLSFVFMHGFSDGTRSKMMSTAVELYPGYLKIENSAFAENPGFDNIVTDTTTVKTVASKSAGVAHVAARFESFGLFSTDDQTIGALFVGIEPEAEAHISRLKSSLLEGRYLESTDTNQVYMGYELAKRLKVKVGDKLSFISNGADYSFAADNIVVGGLFKTGQFSFDNGAVFMNKSYFDTVMASDNLATSIVLGIDKPDNIDTITTTLQSNLPEGYTAINYKESMKDYIKAMEIDEIFGYVQLGIMFAVIFFVIAIYAFLNVFGRIREIGVLRAIGTKPSQIVKLLLIETMILGAIGVGVGGVGAGALLYKFEQTPLKLTDFVQSKEEMAQYEEMYKQYDMVAEVELPANFDVGMIALDMVIFFILTMLSILYPIVMTNRIKPLEAMRHV